MRKQHDASQRSMRSGVVLKPQPAHSKAALIAQCSIATDSVVATATVQTDGAMRRIVVNWGDGTINTLRNRPGLDIAVGHEPLPPGTYKLRHAYQEPPDKKPFSHVVIIRVEDSAGGVDFCVNQITLTPRYRVTQYRTRLNLESQCDSIFEATSEFDIRLTVDQQLMIVLDGSIVSRELIAADPAVLILLSLTETDPIWDDHISALMTLSAHDVSESISRVTEGDGCKVRYSYDKEVTLLVPLPSFGQAVVATA